MQPVAPLPSSYRDPSGFMFERDGILYRQVNQVYREHYDHFMSSGCYQKLVDKNWLVSHTETEADPGISSTFYKVIQPEFIPFISYPFEWSFDMLKDAALLTLSVADECLAHGMLLKDATPFNIQWRGAQPVFIDTLSFEKYDGTSTWIAYRQFCECFVAPLLLIHYSQQPLNRMLASWPEGIPVEMASKLLPFKSRLNLHASLHIHLQSKLSRRIKQPAPSQQHFSVKKISQLLSSLTTLIKSLKWKAAPSQWSKYYEEASGRDDYLDFKKEVITKWIKQDRAFTAVDLGANEGQFSMLTASRNIRTVAADADHDAINHFYLRLKSESIKNVWPVVLDLANPSPAFGFNLQERQSFMQRAKSDMGMALALIHHLCIGRNVSFDQAAVFFAQLCRILIIEFVPREDPKVRFMLTQKKDIYTHYDQPNFIRSFEKYFRIMDTEELKGTGRILYLMEKHD